MSDCHTLQLGHCPALRGELPPLHEIQIKDITLREAEQAAEVAFTVDDKVQFAWKLAEIGIHRIQIGFASPESDRQVVWQLKRDGFDYPLELLCIGFVPSVEADLGRAIETGVDVVNIVYRSAERQLLDGLGIDPKTMLNRSVALVELANRLGAPKVAFTPSYATQADPNFLKEVCRAVVEAGAKLISIPDSLGVASPWNYAWLIHEIHNVVDVPLSVHCHNDFGLALANTLAGLEAGAQVAEVTVNGLGERAGNTALDELFLALNCLYGKRLGVDSSKLVDLAYQLAELTEVSIPPMKPVAGTNVFAQKLEIHVQVAARFPELLEPYSPNLVGQERGLRIGKGTGPVAVRTKLAQLAQEATDEQVTKLVVLISQFAEQHRSSLSDQKFLELLQVARDQDDSSPAARW